MQAQEKHISEQHELIAAMVEQRELPFSSLKSKVRYKDGVDPGFKVRQAVFGQNESMAHSGKMGGTPMVSHIGKQTIVQYVCFSKGMIKVRDSEPEVNEEKEMRALKELVRNELTGKSSKKFIEDLLEEEIQAMDRPASHQST